jgi:hypothetical protein
MTGETGKDKYIKQRINVSGDANTKLTLSGKLTLIPFFKTPLFFVFLFSIFSFALRSECVPQRGIIFPLLQVERKTRIGNRSRALLAQKFFMLR